MPYNDFFLQSFSLERFAFRFTPEIVRAFIPKGVIGVYLLLCKSETVYVGRSDTCLRTRLAYHPHLGCASHFTYEICQSSQRAFYLEAYLFHKLQKIAPQQLLNCIHPSKPIVFSQNCPFCNPYDSKAIRVVFSKLGILGQNLQSSEFFSTSFQ